MKPLLNISDNRLFYLSMVFLFIFGDIICSNYILKSFHNQTHLQQFYSFLILLVLQILASPIQAALSDLYCRKKSLVVALAVSLISLILVYIFIQTGMLFLSLAFLIIALKGIFGNTIPLSFAAIADVRNEKIRLSFGIATSPYTVGYFWLIFTNKTLSDSASTLTSIFIFIFILIVCSLFFNDIRDKTKHKSQIFHLDSAPKEIAFEVKSVVKELFSFSNQMAFISYLLWEISLYTILLLYVDFDVQTFSGIGVAMLCGALAAVFVLKIFEKTKDEKMIKWGYNLSALSLVPFFVLYPFLVNFNFYLLSICYFFHTMGNIILSASLFALMAKKIKPHEYGKIYGLLDSVDTIAFLIASVFIMLYNIYNLNLIYLILFSYLTVTISWIPYAQFKKARAAGA